MKKTITTLMLSFFAIALNSQTVTDFESFTLTANSFYQNNNSVPFQTPTALYRYEWNSQFSFWSGGFAYTNKMDSSTAGFGNLYACRAYKGYNGSAKYATAQANAIMVMKAPYDRLDGFYITNTTYAYKSMRLGDQFAKKFGGPSGNDPDWFKVTAKGYLNGAMKPDSAVFYLADFRFTNNSSDYIVENWQWFNTSNLGEVDSVQFLMYSSDTTGGFMNTPAFFSIDNVTISDVYVGVKENQLTNNLTMFPNPVADKFHLRKTVSESLTATVYSIDGKELSSYEIKAMETELDLSWLAPGAYFIEITSGNSSVTKKLIKN